MSSSYERGREDGREGGGGREESLVVQLQRARFAVHAQVDGDLATGQDVNAHATLTNGKTNVC